MATNYKTGKPYRVLEGYHIDLALLWKRTERSTYPEIIERLVQLFGEEKRVTQQALQKRILAREKELQKGEVVGKSFESADGLSDEDLLTYLRTQLYMHTYIAASKQDVNEMRKSADTLLKVLRAKKDLLGDDADESDKAAADFLRQIQNIKHENDKALVN